MKRPTKEESVTAAAEGHADAKFKQAYPTVSAYLTDVAWDDGKPREASALSLTVKDGSWQAALNDKAMKRSFYSTAPTMMGAIGLLEKALADGVDGWRAWKRGK